MKRFYTGTLLKNSRGRAYLVYRGDTGCQKIYRLLGNPELPGNGERVVIEGEKDGRRIYCVRIIHWPYPRRKPGEKTKVA